MDFNFLYIFALRTVFIDCDLTLPGKCVVIVSPKWQVIGDRKINLDGVDGEPNSRPKANGASDGEIHGRDGEPGIPGNPGGCFLGIGETFVNGSNLTITANGGNGAAGQDGGDGQQLKPISDNSVENIYDGTEDFNGLPLEYIERPSKYWTFMDLKIYNRYSRATVKIRGGLGGKGGVGGKGGDAGFVGLYELNGVSEISQSFRKGKRGDDGRFGEGGEETVEKMDFFKPWWIERIFGAKESTTVVRESYVKGNDTRIREVSSEIDEQAEYSIAENLISEPCQIVNKWFGVEESTTVVRESYVKGNDTRIREVSSEIDEQSEYSIAENFISELYQIVNKYKKFVLENLQCRFRRSSLLEFFNRLNCSDVRSMYNVVGLVEDFIGIEEGFDKFHPKDSYLLSIYQSLLCGISEYAKLIKTEENQIALEVLKYLYTAILSKIYVLSDKSKTNLVIDIGKYLDMLKKDIETLKDLQTAESKSILINKHTKDFSKHVNEKILAAKRLISEEVLPEIRRMGKKVDDDLHSLVKAIIHLQKGTQNEKNCLIMRKQELENSLALKHVFNTFRLISLTVCSLCTLGVSVSPVIKLAASVLEFVALQKEETSSDPALAMSSIFQQFNLGFENERKGSLNFLCKFRGFLCKAIDTYPQYFKDLSPKTKQIEGLTKDQGENKPGLMEIKEIQRNLEITLKNKVKWLKTQLTRETSRDALKVISILNTFLELGSFIPGFENDQMETAELLKLANAIGETDKKLIILRKQEENIFRSIAAMIGSMEKNILEAANNLSSKSRIALVVSKWQVQRSLKNVQLQIKELLQGFKEQDGILSCFDMLQEAITVLVQVYDHIESYRDQETLAKYIADISTVAFHSDHHLSSAKNQLDIQLKRNLILNHYKTASDAFSQWMFPFSQNFIKDSNLPDPFRFENRSIESLVSDCLKNIEWMKMNVQADRTLVRSNDGYVHHSDFNSQNVATVPFFTWKEEKYGNLISRLFSGQEIKLKADVNESPINKDVIKFKFIEFRFRCRSESLQPQLDRVLKGFDIVATHTGNSYYRCENRIYLIGSEKMTFSYSFEKNENGKSVRKNAVIDKIKKGNMMLSPYTLWYLKLVNSDKRGSFNKLKEFTHNVDLELGGHGSYISNGNELNLEAEQHRIVEVINEIN